MTSSSTEQVPRLVAAKYHSCRRKVGHSLAAHKFLHISYSPVVHLSACPNKSITRSLRDFNRRLFMSSNPTYVDLTILHIYVQILHNNLDSYVECYFFSSVTCRPVHNAYNQLKVAQNEARFHAMAACQASNVRGIERRSPMT